MNFCSAFDILSPLLCQKLDNENIWFCNKNLYKFSTLSYLTKGKMECFPKCLFMVPPGNEGYNKILLNIDLYIILCRNTKEYVLCTLKQIRKFVGAKSGFWNAISIFSYVTTSLENCGASCYKFATH
jgi:hypothetical protein